MGESARKSLTDLKVRCFIDAGMRAGGFLGRPLTVSRGDERHDLRSSDENGPEGPLLQISSLIQISSVRSDIVRSFRRLFR